MKKWHIFFISGVAWAGKWTVIKKLLEKQIENLELALSCKTREYRDWEKPWIDYHKLSVNEFKQSIKEWDFLEYNFIHNQNYYGTKYTDVIDNGIHKGKIILKEMDILSLPKLMYARQDLKNDYTYIFLDLSTDKIKVRMQERWDCVEWKDFENRLSSAKKEAALKNLANFVINADQSPDKVFEDIFSIISKKL